MSNVIKYSTKSKKIGCNTFFLFELAIESLNKPEQKG